MANCLITQLNATVQGDDFPYLNKIVLPVKNGQRVYVCPIEGESIHVSISNGFTFSVYGQSGLTEKTIDEYNVNYYVDIVSSLSVVGYLSIETKKNIGVYRVSYSEGYSEKLFDINQLSGCVNLNYINLNHAYGDLKSLKSKPINYLRLEAVSDLNNLTGNIEDLSTMTDMTMLHLVSSKNIRGSVSALSGMTKLTNLDLYNTFVSGDFCALMNSIAAHKQNGDQIHCYMNNTPYLTFSTEPTARDSFYVNFNGSGGWSYSY